MTRVRSRINVHPKFATAYYRYYRNPPVLSYETPYEVVLEHETETITDVVTPEFQKKSNEGEVIINPVSHVKVSEYTVGSGSYHWTRTNGRQYKEDGPGLTSMQIQRYPHYMNYAPAEPEPSYDMEAAAKLQALGNVDRSPYGFAEDIAEMRETLKFLRDPLGAFKKLSDAFHERTEQLLKAKKYLRRADALAQAWLEFRFAVSPLYRSLDDLTRSLFIDEDPIRPKRRVARGGSEFSELDSKNGVIVTWDSEATTKVDISAHAGIVYEHTNPIVDWKYTYGLRFKDIPETLWAVLPLSFMVDRIFNLSQSLRGLESFLDPNVKMLGAWSTQKKTVTETQTWIGHVSTIVASVEKSEIDTNVKVTEMYDRVPWEPAISDLVPEVRVKGLVDSASKVLDLLTIVWSNFR